MYRSGMLSLALSLFLACLTLVLVTRAFVLAALASACIASVVLVFLGAMQLLGWTLGAPRLATPASATCQSRRAVGEVGVATGVVECVGIAIMVGLAVDYIVHMSTAVAHCGLRGRDAVGFALRTVGLSVVSGAVTTIGAAVFLLPCEMAVFQQFGAPLLSMSLEFGSAALPRLLPDLVRFKVPRRLCEHVCTTSSCRRLHSAATSSCTSRRGAAMQAPWW